MTNMKSILVATDLSEGSDEIVRAAAGVARLTGAALHVVHSFDLQRLPYSESHPVRATFAGRFEHAEEALRLQLARTVEPEVVIGSQEVVIYLAHRAILDLATSLQADLIVLGPHRPRPRADAILGSTADRVLRASTAPCLVVRTPLHLPPRRVLVPTDLSEAASGALDVALAWSGAGSYWGSDDPAELTVIHVVPPEFASDNFPFDREVIAPELHRQLAEAQAAIDSKVEPRVRELVRWGVSPAEEIVAVAVEENVDLVVMGTHGQGGFKRALIGSIASGVARRVGTSILLVPPNFEG